MMTYRVEQRNKTHVTVNLWRFYEGWGGANRALATALATYRPGKEL